MDEWMNVWMNAIWVSKRFLIKHIEASDNRFIFRHLVVHSFKLINHCEIEFIITSNELTVKNFNDPINFSFSVDLNDLRWSFRFLSLPIAVGIQNLCYYRKKWPYKLMMRKKKESGSKIIDWIKNANNQKWWYYAGRQYVPNKKKERKNFDDHFMVWCHLLKLF